MTFEVLVIVQALLTWIMVGIIWFTQLIHYPLYEKVKEGFVEYERAHMRRTAVVVGPIMFFEALVAIMLVTMAEGDLMARLATANLVALILVWISTFLFQMGQHQKLTVRFSHKIFRNLLATNWIRTIFWTVKGAILFWMIHSL